MASAVLRDYGQLITGTKRPLQPACSILMEAWKWSQWLAEAGLEMQAVIRLHRLTLAQRHLEPSGNFPKHLKAQHGFQEVKHLSSLGEDTQRGRSPHISYLRLLLVCYENAV